jgi:hypothetical protein
LTGKSLDSEPPSFLSLSDAPGSKELAEPPRICAQCNAGGEPLYPVPGTDLWLHPECRRFWAKANSGIPASVDRTPNPPALGPEGDSLDDFK